MNDSETTASRILRPRILAQYDAMGNAPSPLVSSVDEWRALAFQGIDQPGSQVDAICWDCAYGNYAICPSRVLPPHPHPAVQQWLNDGQDWVGVFVQETRRRGLGLLWNHRISEVDVGAKGLDMENVHPVKAAHPDWLIPTWWWQGLWNLAVPAVHDYKLAILAELLDRYDFDGFQIDFARHVPVLPIGRQWRLRHRVTAFLQRVRALLDEKAAATGRRRVLLARVPRSPRECRADGFDVATWAREGLVDGLTLGSRSFEVDLAGYRKLVGPGVALRPCLDDHHATDGYRYPALSVFRGVAANWWDQGADGIVLFNWHHAVHLELGDPDTLAGKGLVVPVERRGGYPWAEGAFNRNEHAQLPVPLPYDGRTPARIRLSVPAAAQRVADGRARLCLVCSAAAAGDELACELDRRSLSASARDDAWQDAQIFAPRPQPPSGGAGVYKQHPQQRLLRLEYCLDSPPAPGVHEVRVSVRRQAPHCCRRIVLEKVELHCTAGSADFSETEGIQRG